jgi:hypothetical protein
MPNYKLSSTVREDMVRRAGLLVDRRVQFVAGDFPLTTAQVQAAVLDPERLAALHKLRATGVHGLPEYQHVHLLLAREHLPGLARSCIVYLTLPEEIFCDRPSTYLPGRDDFSPGANGPLTPDWSGLDDAERAELATWGNNIVKATRHAGMVRHTVGVVLNNCLSIGHVLAWWPAAASLVTDKDWKTRFRNGPRSLRSYAPPANLATRITDLLRASEVVLSAAELLPEYKNPEGSIVAALAKHEMLPTDRKFG